MRRQFNFNNCYQKTSIHGIILRSRAWATKLLKLMQVSIVGVNLALSATSLERSEYLQLRLSIGRGDYKEALSRCARLLDQYPTAIRLYEAFAEVGQYCSRLSEVNMMLGDRVRAGKEVRLALFGRGHVFLKDGQWANALEMFDRAIYFGLRSPLVYAGRELAYEKQFGIETAIEYYLAMSHHEPDNSGIWYSLALAYWSRCDPSNSRLAIDEALRIAPDESKYTQLKAGMMCTWLLDESTIDYAMTEVEEAIENCDFDGAEFVRWCLIDGLYSRGREKLATSIVSESYESVCRFGQVKWLAHIHLTSAVNQLSLGESREALHHANVAAKCFSLVNDVEGILSSKGLEIGILRESSTVEDALKCCLDFYSGLAVGGDARLRGGAFVEIAWTLSEIGAFQPALALIIEAQRILQRCTYAEYDQIRLNTALGLIHQKIGHFDLAFRYHLRSLQLAKASSSSRWSITACEGNVAGSLLLLGDTLGARKHFQRQLTLARSLKEIGQEKEALLQLAGLDVAQNLRASAKARTRLALTLAQKQSDEGAISRCHYLLGWISETEGRRETAKDYYTRVLQFFMEQGKHRYLYMLSRESISWFHSQRDELINALCRIEQGEMAWALAESSRRGVSLAYLMRMASGMNSMRPTHECQDFRRCVYSFSNLRLEMCQVLDAEHPNWGQFVSVLSGCIAAIDTIQRISRESLHLRQYAEDQFDFDGIAQNLRDRALGTHVAMLDFWVCESSVIRFLVTCDTIAHHIFMMGRDTVKRWVTPLIEQLCGKGGFDQGFGGVVQSSTTPLRNISDSLLDGARELLAEKKELVVVASSPLDALPFEGLTCQDSVGLRFLVETVAVSYASCLSFLDPSLQPDAILPAPILVLADPVPGKFFLSDAKSRAESIQFGHGIESNKLELPVARKEASKIREIFESDCIVKIGSGASETWLKQEAPNFSVIHLAAHAVTRKMPGESQAICLSQTERDDGVLSYNEIVGLNFHGDLIVISGCNTAVSDDVHGYGSLAEAFLEAGASSVVATRFEIEDAVSDRFMSVFYRYLKEGQSKARSLQLAKIEMMKEGYTDTRLWSAYQLYGRNGGIALVGQRPDEPFASMEALVALSVLFLMVSGFAIGAGKRNVKNDLGTRVPK